MIAVATVNAASRRGVLRAGARVWPCAIGHGGIRARKREGDGGSPRGTWRMVEVWYRPDRVKRPRAGLPVRALGPCEGWCDAPGNRNYNRAVRLPYPASAEMMWRADGLYDLGVVIDYNLCPRVHGRGSAIFLHVARDGWPATEGCIALERRHLERLLPLIGRRTRLRIGR